MGAGSSFAATVVPLFTTQRRESEATAIMLRYIAEFVQEGEPKRMRIDARRETLCASLEPIRCLSHRSSLGGR